MKRHRIMFTALEPSTQPSSRSTGEFDQQNDGASVPAEQTGEGWSIYVVDDEPDLADFYALLLEEAGCVVTTFNDRARALTALKEESNKPDLLITDYRGVPMPVECFIRQCRRVHPELRILMASGCSERNVWVSEARPDRFIRKPFMADEFWQAVKAALNPSNR
jgi:DNA-binding response OmpR family regulator